VDGFRLCLECIDENNGAKNFLLLDLGIRYAVEENGGLEVASLIADGFTAGKQSSLCLPLFNIGRDTFILMRIHDRSNEGIRIIGMTKDLVTVLDSSLERLDEFRRNTFFDVNPSTGSADLSAQSNETLDALLNRDIQVAVCKDERRTLSAEFEGYPLDCLRSRDVDFNAGCNTSGKGNLFISGLVYGDTLLTSG